MYNVGFGDCFLIEVPAGDGSVLRIVIDCGSLKNKSKPIKSIAQQLLKDVTVGGRRHIDLLVMTHRHADHISGFDKELWKDVDVGEVWMPWVESLDDPDAIAIRKSLSARAAALTEAVTQFSLGLDLAEVALNARSNADSLEVLHGGFARKIKPRFFPRGRSVVEKVGRTPLPGVEIHVLGPPRDRELLNIPESAGQTLLTGYMPDSEFHAAEKFRPFSSDWNRSFGSLSEVERKRIDDAASKEESYRLMAAELDADINNTSLILIFSIGDEYLLFPGDAQWGPWSAILDDPEARELLGKVTFLKVSHHASHNGTPKDLLSRTVGSRKENVLGAANKRGGLVAAMVSMTPYSGWPGIPYRRIYDTFKERGWPFVVSDAFAATTAFSQRADQSIELDFGLLP